MSKTQRVPSYTAMFTCVWLSRYVVKVWVFCTGIVVFRGTKKDITLPSVSIPRERGVTSRRSKPVTAESAPACPVRIAACTAAPYATLSLGLMLLFKRLPLKKSLSKLWIFGIRVLPPTKTTSSMDALSHLASRKQLRYTKESQSCVSRVLDDVWTTVTSFGLNSQGRGKTSLRRRVWAIAEAERGEWERPYLSTGVNTPPNKSAFSSSN